jgi:dienelactone hydrolase
MAHIVLFHSVLGLRAIERDLAREWEGAGHAVTLPDLYGGGSAEDYDGGFALLREVGRATVGRRAAEAAASAPGDAVLAGVSMGAGLVGDLWGTRPASRGALLIAGSANWDPGLRPGLPVQAHIARPDPFDDEAYFADWAETNPGVALDLRRYEGVGHYFLDPSLADFGEEAARTCRAAMLTLLAGL